MGAPGLFATVKNIVKERVHLYLANVRIRGQVKVNRKQGIGIQALFGPNLQKMSDWTYL